MQVSKPVSWYLFRHGRATWSTTGYGEQIMTAQLLPEAEPAIKKLAHFLQPVKPDVFVASPVARCQQTAQLIAEQTHTTFETDSRVTEFHLETYDDLAVRVQAVIDEVTRREVQTVWICTHGTVIAAFKHLLLDGTMSPDYELDYPSPAGLYLIQGQHFSAHTFE